MVKLSPIYYSIFFTVNNQERYINYSLNEKLNSTLCRNLVFHKCADSCSMSYCLLLRSRKRQLCQSLYPEIINT